MFRDLVFKSLKRLSDLLFSFVLIVVTLPLQLLVAILIWLYLGKPVLFKQKRPGKDGKIFTMIKFRTMLEPDDDHVSDHERLTGFGRALRSTSIDELPTLINVLKGEMSMVGPRPLLVKYLELYTEEQNRRHEVRPGITGLAQVNGRNNTTWEERLKLDVEYVKNIGFALDLKIIFLTINQVLKRKDIAKDGHATMPEFDGSFEINE